MMTLSVIVPVYNVKDYLSACLESIFEQPEGIGEVILIDDCSTDGSGRLCDVWSEKDSRIRVHHLTQNGGLSHARNIGIELAQGDYLAFVDSDDTVLPGTFAACMHLVSEHPEIEVVEFPIWVHYGAHNAYLYQPVPVGKEDYLSWIRRQGFLHSYACNKVYHSRLWKSIRFPEHRKYEDMFTIPYVLKQTDQIFAFNEGVYFYYSRTDSITQTLSLLSYKDLLDANLLFFNCMQCDLSCSRIEIDRYYLELCNLQIVYLELGGKWVLPSWRPSLSLIFQKNLTFMARFKALLLRISSYYCCLVFAKFRKWGN